jgi:hypothetical protein
MILWIMSPIKSFDTIVSSSGGFVELFAIKIIVICRDSIGILICRKWIVSRSLSTSGKQNSGDREKHNEAVHGSLLIKMKHPQHGGQRRCLGDTGHVEGA